MPDIGDIQSARISGMVVLSRNADLFLRLDMVAEALAGYLQRNRFRDVRQRGNRIVFAGQGWNFGRIFNQRSRDLADIVDQGAVKVALQGSEVVAEYSLKIIRRYIADLATTAAWLSLILLYFRLFEDGVPLEVRRFWPIILAVVAGSMLADRFIRARWFMKRRLPKAARAAENRIAVLAGAYDTSRVDPAHREQGPADLLRTARFYDENNFPDKARAYLAYLVETYSWTDEAETAVKELSPGSGRLREKGKN